MFGHYLPREEFAEAVADHGDAGTGLALVVPGLSPAHQSLAVLGPGEVRLAQDLPEHRIDRVGLSAKSIKAPLQLRAAFGAGGE
jgi:hypothetical protein